MRKLWTNAASASVILAAVTFSGCSQVEDWIDKLPTPVPTGSASTTPTPTPLPSSIPTSTPRPTATMTPLPSPTGSPDESGRKACVGSFVSTKLGYMDGPLKFLWKNGDSTKKVAVIIDCSYSKPDRVEVYAPNGKAETLAYAGVGNPGACGDRWHYRGSKPTGSYQGKVAVFTGDKVCTYTFKNMPRVD